MYRKTLLLALVGFALANPAIIDRSNHPHKDGKMHNTHTAAAAGPKSHNRSFNVEKEVEDHAHRAVAAARRACAACGTCCTKRYGGWTAVANGASAIVDPIPVAGPLADAALHTAGAVLDGTQAVLEQIPIVGPVGGAVLDTAGALLGGAGQAIGGVTQGILGGNGLLGGGLLGGNGGILGGITGGLGLGAGLNAQAGFGAQANAGLLGGIGGGLLG